MIRPAVRIVAPPLGKPRPTCLQLVRSVREEVERYRADAAADEVTDRRQGREN